MAEIAPTFNDSVGNTLDALQRLAGNVAHDCNNLLTIVMGYGALIADTFDAGDPRLEDLAEIRHAVERTCDMTRHLITFSGTRLLSPQPVDLNRVIDTAAPLLRRVMGDHIAVVLRLDDDVPMSRWHAGQIEQVLVTLAIQARESMPHGGTFTLETQLLMTPPANSSPSPAVADGPWLCLRVIDTGVGMEPSALPHTFEPFNAVSARGDDAGLGLSAVYGIVHQAGGQIDVVSTLGRGTTFTIVVPVVPVPAEEEEPSRPQPASRRDVTAAGSETVLVVEDDQGVRDLIRRILILYGYRVIDACSPNDAMARSAGASSVDLLLSDWMLPEMPGVRLAALLRSRWPGLRVLFMSGSSPVEVPPRPEPAPDAMFVEKPFAPQVLVQRVRQALDESAS